MTKDDALKILEELGNSPNMVKHAKACGFVMRTLAKKLISHPSRQGRGSPKAAELETVEDDWEKVGLLHDADYELTNKSLELHTEETTKKLKGTGVDQLIIDAIRGHCDKAPRDTLMAKAIYAADELTGLIVACALVQPDKKLKSVTVESVIKKFKDNSFARGASRDQIKTCETELEIPLEEFIATTLKAMQENSDGLGL